MKIVISSGHGKYVRGAAGSPIPPYLDERDENVRVVDEVARILNGAGVQTTVFHDNVSTTQNENLNRIVNFHNSKIRDWDVSVHFNSYQTTPTPMGTEVLYVSSTGGTMARTVVDKIAENGLTNRGAKQRTDLFFLNNTEMPAILIEVCFVDSKADCGVYREEFTPICYSIAEGLAGRAIDEAPPVGGGEPPVRPPTDTEEDDAIAAIAEEAEIARYSWRDRGVAPVGYIKGFALAWAQVVRKYNAGNSAAREMGKANTHNNGVDVLAWYADEFEHLGMANEVAGLNTLRHLFALLLGLGMRESSGKHCEGRDMSAANVTSETAEAGLFQTSYNARSGTPEFQKTMDAYQNGDYRGYVDYFQEDVHCDQDSWHSYGSGDGYQFQVMCKSEPAFAVETCALTLRNLRQHYGPINRKEAELREEADWMLLDVQRYLASREAVA